MKKFSFMFLFLVPPAFSDTLSNPCENIELSQQVAQCAAYRKDLSDELLTTSYKATLGRIRQQFERMPSLADQYISVVKEAQQHWIKLRDADCKMEAFEIEETTEAHQVTTDNCISRMSNNRADYLDGIAPDI